MNNIDGNLTKHQSISFPEKIYDLNYMHEWGSRGLTTRFKGISMICGQSMQ